MGSIQVSGGSYVSIGSHVKLTDDAKNIKLFIDGVPQYIVDQEGKLILDEQGNMIQKKKYGELMNDMYNRTFTYLLVKNIDNNEGIITVIIPGDQSGSYNIYDPMHLEFYIPRPETPPAPPYNERFLRSTWTDSNHTGDLRANTAAPLSPARWGRRFKRTRRNNRKRKTRRSSNRK